jgi:hypothetical protein
LVFVLLLNIKTNYATLLTHMILYKKINLKCLEELKSYLINKILNQIPDSVVPKPLTELIILPDDLLKVVNNELNSYGIGDIDYARLYLWPKKAVQYVHIDGSDLLDGSNYIYHGAINIPLYGGENSIFRWYIGGEFDNVQYYNESSDQKLYIIKWKSIPKSESLEMIDGCYLVRIDIPHHAINPINSDRWIFTMRFKDNQPFESLYEKLPASNI